MAADLVKILQCNIIYGQPLFKPVRIHFNQKHHVAFKKNYKNHSTKGILTDNFTINWEPIKILPSYAFSAIFLRNYVMKIISPSKLNNVI